MSDESITFLLFVCDQFYPRGGWRDFHSGHWSVTMAILNANEVTGPQGDHPGQHWHVIDLATLRVIAQG